MKEYQQFAISNFRTGFNEAVEPWMLPRDAYQSMINAHLYRGVLEKILGYRPYAYMSYRNLMVLSYTTGNTWTGTMGTAPTTSNFAGYGTILAGSTAEIFIYANDASPTLINLVGNNGGTGTVNLTTKEVTLNFFVNPPDGDVLFQWDSASPGDLAIMGIKPYYAADGSQDILVFDELRVGKVVDNFGVLGENAGVIQGISELPHAYYQSAVFTGDGDTAVFDTTSNATALNSPLVPGTVAFTQYTSTGEIVNGEQNGLFVSQGVKDNGTGELLGPNVASGSVNYATGAYTITFSSNIDAGNYFDSTVGVYGNLFSGNISNFFSLTNYQYKAFFCNNIDPIFYYDGFTVQYLNTNLFNQIVVAAAGRPAYNITSTLHVFAYRERLLLISPVVEAVQQLSAVFWSSAGNPLDFTNDEQLYAPTSEPIRTFGYINSDLVIRFARSERVFRYTGDAFSPFRFDSTNNMWANDASYSAINYDKWFSSVGKPAIVYSDAVNVKRADEMIPDFTQPTDLSQQIPVPFINQTSIQQCYGERFDDIKEGWLCYNSAPSDETGVVASDNVLGFNYLDGTYAVYSFPLSCLGFGSIINGPTWGSIYTNWEDMSDNWGDYSLQDNSLIDLGGDQYDTVYELNSGNIQTNVAGETIPLTMSVISKNFNPFIEDGQLARFGYLDLFVSAYSDTTLRVQFYVNDQLALDSTQTPIGFYQETILQFNTFDAMSPNTMQTKVWKRIYVGAVGKSHTIRFYQQAADLEGSTDDQPVYIHAMVLWMKPAGRIFQ